MTVPVKLQEPLTSRYKDTDLIVPEDRPDVVCYDLWNTPREFTAEQATAVVETVIEPGRLDLTAYYHLLDPAHWWIIAFVNALRDQVEDLPPGMLVNVPRRQIVDQFAQR